MGQRRGWARGEYGRTDPGSLFQEIRLSRKESKNRRQWLKSGTKREVLVIGFRLCLPFRMRELRVSWNADNKESVKRRMIKIQEREFPFGPVVRTLCFQG